MKMNNIVKVLSIALFAMVIGGGIVTAAHVGDHGAAYMTPDGLAELKAGSLEIGKYSVWNDHDVAHHKTCVINVGGVDYEITYKMTGSGGKIVGVSKVVPTPVENETEPQNDTPVVPTNDTPVDPEPQNVTPVVPQNETPVENETTPIVDPVDEPEDDPSIVDPIVDPIDLVNDTTPEVPHVSGDDVTSANGANASADVDEVQTPAKLMKAPIKMQKAGNEWAILAIAILVIICAVGYKRY